MNIAILGFGTIGSGVYELIEKDTKNDLHAVKVLDIRDLSGTPAAGIVTKEIRDITENADIELVVETMGGEHPAYEFVKACLEAGKHVVTSNKNLVAAYGAELMAIAAERERHFLFEAAVGGAIPVIRAMTESLQGEVIIGIRGILNGTTNFILTKMDAEGVGYEDALKDAQKLGYAEADPTADVGGWDACRKIAILASIMSGRKIEYKDIPTEGITKITAADIEKAKADGKAIKLIAGATLENGVVTARVQPELVGYDDALHSVKDSYNAVEVIGEGCEKLMFYGRGAGKLPTASAVLGDIIEAKNMPPRKEALWK